MFTVDQKIISLRIIIQLVVLISFTTILNEWALVLAISVFSRGYVNKRVKRTYYFMRKRMAKEQ